MPVLSHRYELDHASTVVPDASQSVWHSAVVGSVADGSIHAALQPLRSVTSNANRMAAGF